MEGMGKTRAISAQSPFVLLSGLISTLGPYLRRSPLSELVKETPKALLSLDENLVLREPSQIHDESKGLAWFVLALLNNVQVLFSSKHHLESHFDHVLRVTSWGTAIPAACMPLHVHHLRGCFH